MATDVKNVYVPAEVPVSSVLFNKKPFNPNGGHSFILYNLPNERVAWLKAYGENGHQSD